MTRPPFGDEIQIMEIEGWARLHAIPETARCIAALGDAIDRRDAAIADLTVTLAAERARNRQVPVDVLAPLREAPDAG